MRIAARLPDDSTLVARRLTELSSGLYASPAYLARHGVPANPADLQRHIGLGMIDSSSEPQPWRLTNGPARWEGLPSGPLASNSVGPQRTLAANDMGITGRAERFAGPLVEQGLLKRVLPAWQLPTMTVWCVTPGRRLLPACTLPFIEMIKAALVAKRGAPDLPGASAGSGPAR